MSIHIDAAKNAIAQHVLLPGDPLRAELIATELLENAKCYNKVRNMLGFTGTYNGQSVSVQATGMGMPSMSIYAHELLSEYQAKTLIRIGTAGALQANIKLGELVLAQATSTDSKINRQFFEAIDFAPIADFELLSKACALAEQQGYPYHVGNVLTTDCFYSPNDDDKEIPYADFRRHNGLAVDMESAALYSLAARFNAKALAILTISDHLITGERASSQSREQNFLQMTDTALKTLFA